MHMHMYICIGLTLDGLGSPPRPTMSFSVYMTSAVLFKLCHFASKRLDEN